MSTIQRSIEVNAPITKVYVQLIRFEDYPRFLEDVERVEKTDLRHLHWTVKNENRLVEWDAELTEQEENRHIVWHDAHDRSNNGRIDLDELGPNLSRISVTLNTDRGRLPGISGAQTLEDLEQRLNHDLANLKDFLEDRRPQFDAPRMEADTDDADGLDAQQQADIMNEARQSSMRRTPENMSGSPTEVLEDEPNEFGVDGLIRSNAQAAPSSGAKQERPAK